MYIAYIHKFPYGERRVAAAKPKKKSANYPDVEPDPYGPIPDIEIYLPQQPQQPQPQPPTQPGIKIPQPAPPPRPIHPQQIYVPVPEDISTPHIPIPDHTQGLIIDTSGPYFPPSPISPLLPIPPTKQPQPVHPPSPVSPLLPISPVHPLLPVSPFPPTKPDNNIYEVMQAGEMAQLIAIDVVCAMTSMRIHIVFDRIYDGVIYSKGFFGDQSCHFVPWGSGRDEYEFEVTLDKCGTQFIDNMASGGTAFLENTLLLQNEPGIQEMWDMARRVQCTWEGKMDHSVATAFEVDMLDTISVAYSGDDISAEMSVIVGRGPFGQPAQGLIRIGESLSIVISVFGSGEMDIHIHDCIAHDGDKSKALQLSDADGCIVKKKLMGAWQFTRETGNTGASLIAHANLKAFRFPDKTDVYLECGLEICKEQCPNFCPEYPSIDFRSLPRAKRNVDSDPRDATLVRTFRVIDESVDNNSSVLLFDKNSRHLGDFCVSILGFSLGLTFVVLLSFLALIAVFVCTRMMRKRNTQAALCKHKQGNF
uniref:ZP domain-containing protein n=1 Tax=Strigamia maritima TaxID=126957 RepID=T1ISB6_STRMM